MFLKPYEWMESSENIPVLLLDKCQLDFAVAKALGFRTEYNSEEKDVWFDIVKVANSFDNSFCFKCIASYSVGQKDFNPSNGNSYSINIIEKNKISTDWMTEHNLWHASLFDGNDWYMSQGDTFNDAAMRAFVISKLGNTVLVPSISERTTGVTYEQD